MYLDILDFQCFYTKPLGRLTRRMIARQLALSWQTLINQKILGYGYTVPYLGSFTKKAGFCVSFAPAAQGIARWPQSKANCSALVLPDILPLCDASIDRLLLVHALEMAEHPEEMLLDMRRVLVSGGRLLIVVANRRGLWASTDKTPFGYGRPYTSGQLTHLLRRVGFEPLQWRSALHFLPFKPFIGLGSSLAFEKFRSPVLACPVRCCDCRSGKAHFVPFIRRENSKGF